MSFDLNKQKTFGNGHIYTALSRAKNTNGLFVSGKAEKSKIKADQDALDAYGKRRKKKLIFLNEVIFVARFQIDCCYS